MTTSAMTATAESATMFWVTDDLVWLLVVGFIAAFLLAFSVGANDVANSFGTSVGAKVLTLRQACILATVFETAGAVLIGAKVGEMIRKGIIDVEIYQSEKGTTLLMMGEVAAMFGSGIWQLIATYLKVPVSGTHSIVGACIGFSLVTVGSNGVRWSSIGFIVASWFISPVLSGIMAVLLYHFIRKFIIENKNPLKNGLLMLPVFYGFTVGFNTFSILYSGAPLLGLDGFPVWGTLLISFGGMILVAMAVQYFVVPKIRQSANNLEENAIALTSVKDIESMTKPNLSTSSSKSSLYPSTSRCEGSCSRENRDGYQKKESSLLQVRRKLVRFEQETSGDSSDDCEPKEKLKIFPVQLVTSSDSFSSLDETESFNKVVEFKRTKTKSPESEKQEKKEEVELDSEKDEEDPFVVRQLFSSIQILTACFASFAHGGNDVSNAIGPLIALWIIFWSGNVVQRAYTPWYLLFYGGVGISIGLWLLGRRVMETIGKDLTEVTPSRGFCIELMTALTVLVASNLGIPISTTHCKVGAVVSIGWYRSRAAVKWSIVRNIAFAWFVTLPVAGIFGAGAMYILIQFV